MAESDYEERSGSRRVEDRHLCTNEVHDEPEVCGVELMFWKLWLHDGHDPLTTQHDAVQDLWRLGLR